MNEQPKPLEKPTLSFWQIWNISFGFLGIQIGFALQNGNTSRILQAIGADVHNLGYFWLAAPIAGLIVQPIIGLFSDGIWTPLGRRIPFILLGAIISAAAMFFMPNSEHFAHLMPAVLFGAMMLLLMDTSFNITMQPFRALVSDMLPEKQRNKGYSVQSMLINIGQVLGSMLPILMTQVIGISNEPAAGEKVADSVIWSFYIGGGILLATVLWTSFTTKEYPPEDFDKYNVKESEKEVESMGFWQTVASAPKIMLQLGVVQFFSWFALFLMWVNTTPAIAESVWGTTDPHSKPYNDAGDWTGFIFAGYSAVAAIYAAFLPKLVDTFGRKNTYMLSLLAGGIGLALMLLFKDKYSLFISMIGVGMAWAAILSLPYAILSSRLPAKKMGVYMGIFNAAITIGQIAAGALGGLILKQLLGGNTIGMLAVAGASMFLAGILAKIIVEDREDTMEELAEEATEGSGI